MDKNFAEDVDELDWREWKAARDSQIISGVRLGVGLALLSIALNGMSDDCGIWAHWERR